MNPIAAPPKILVVEDNASVRKLLEYKLSEEFSVQSCSDGQEALPYLCPEVQTIVADLNMPHLGGLELLVEVEKRKLEIPTILITGMPSLETAQEAMAHRAFRYVAKPVRLEQLANLVRLGTRLYQSHHPATEDPEHGLEASDTAEAHAQLGYLFDEALDMMWLALQPIRDTKRNCIHGYEVLLRTGLRELDNPEKFIAVAEELGRMKELSRRVRMAAAQALCEMDPRIILFLNLHAQDMADHELFDPQSMLSHNAHRVVLEITEHRGWPNANLMRRRIGKLRALGFRIALDDLGAGQNGLSRLCAIMPDLVKLDRRLVHRIHHSPLQMDLVRALSSICRKSNIAVIAEGVEEEQEYEALRSAECTLMQGYLFGRPQRYMPLSI